MTKLSSRNSFKKKFNKRFKSLFLFSKTLPGELTKLASVIVIVLLLSWGISSATGDEFEQATKNFSVIGTVSALSDTTISLIDSRGSDTTVEELYNLNIEHLTKIETKDYQPLIISDVHTGDTIIAQGVTDGSTFFITRIVSFSSTPLPPPQEIATSTPEEIATTTEDVATSTDDIADDPSLETTPPEESATTTPTEEATTTEDIATSTEETTQEDTASTTETVIDTVTDIIEDGVDQVSDVLDTIIDTITGSEEPTPPAEELSTPQPETQTESPPVQ